MKPDPLAPEKAAKVRIMMNNMSRQYHDYFYFQAMTTYDSLIEAATCIEDAIYNGTHVSRVKEEDPKGKKIALVGEESRKVKSISCMT